jgi:transposase
MSPTEYQQLVEFLGRQFAEVDRRFTEVDRRFTETNGRIAETNGQIAALRGEMLEHFDELYRRLDRLEQEYQATPRRCDGSRQRWPTSGASVRYSSATSGS